MEFFQKGTNITHLNSADDISEWKLADIKVIAIQYTASPNLVFNIVCSFLGRFA